MSQIKSSSKSPDRFSVKSFSSSKSREGKAASKINSTIRQYLSKKSLATQDFSDVCSTTPVTVNKNNLYVYLPTPNEEVPLFSIFDFKSMAHGIVNLNFFSDFHERFSESFLFHYRFVHKFLIEKTSENEFDFQILLPVGMSDSIELYMEEYKHLWEPFFLPYLKFSLANNKIDIENIPVYTKFFAVIYHPLDVVDDSKIHKDYSMRTCLTFLDSPTTTELAFDVNELNLSWLSCSPLFRFKTSEKLCTLCFNDNLMEHAPPFYKEEPGTNDDEDDLGDNDEEYEGNINSEPLVREGNVFSFSRKKYGRQSSRSVVYRPSSRKIIMCMFYDAKQFEKQFYAPNKFKSVNVNSVTLKDLLDYRIDVEEEKRSLSPELIEDLLKNSTLAGFEFAGGKNKKNKRRTVKRKKTISRRNKRKYPYILK